MIYMVLFSRSLQPTWAYGLIIDSRGLLLLKSSTRQRRLQVGDIQQGRRLLLGTLRMETSRLSPQPRSPARRHQFIRRHSNHRRRLIVMLGRHLSRTASWVLQASNKDILQSKRRPGANAIIHTLRGMFSLKRPRIARSVMHCRFS